MTKIPKITREDGAILEAECPDCDEKFRLAPMVNDTENPRDKLARIYAQHRKTKHSEDVNQAAARIVREATERN